jgi:hypothetical protein
MNRLDRKPDPENKVGLRGKEASWRNPGVNAKNDDAQMRVKKSPNNSKEESNKPSGESRRPVTNQDEGKNIVNGQTDGPMGERETEGD